MPISAIAARLAISSFMSGFRISVHIQMNEEEYSGVRFIFNRIATHVIAARKFF